MTTSTTVNATLPTIGDLVHVRSRRWLVEEVIPARVEGESARVRLACADDDNQGQLPEVFWEYELDRRVLAEEGWTDLAQKGFDSPREFGAYLHTLRWNCMTATDLLAIDPQANLVVIELKRTHDGGPCFSARCDPESSSAGRNGS